MRWHRASSGVGNEGDDGAKVRIKMRLKANRTYGVGSMKPAPFFENFSWNISRTSASYRRLGVVCIALMQINADYYIPTRDVGLNTYSTIIDDVNSKWIVRLQGVGPKSTRSTATAKAQWQPGGSWAENSAPLIRVAVY